MDSKYTRIKLNQATAIAEHAKTLPPEARTFRAFTGAMDALYACLEWLPDELQAEARKTYDALNGAIEQDSEE